VVTPASLSVAPGEAARVSVHAPQGGAFGILSDRCTGIAVPVVQPDALKVSGLASGRCSVTLTAASGVTVRVPIEVGSELGPLALQGAKTPVELSRAAAILAHGTSVTIHVTQGSYAGPFSVGGNCKGIAGITGLGNWLTVVALDPGTCSAQVVGLAGRKTAFAITVEPSPQVRP
jgi:hypothetical protein